jgi:hypothetical protein
MPTIGIYVPSIGIKSGFDPVFDPGAGSGVAGPGPADEPFFRIRGKGVVPAGVWKAPRAFKTVFRAVEWVGVGWQV